MLSLITAHQHDKRYLYMCSRYLGTWLSPPEIVSTSRMGIRFTCTQPGLLAFGFVGHDSWDINYNLLELTLSYCYIVSLHKGMGMTYEIHKEQKSETNK